MAMSNAGKAIVTIGVGGGAIWVASQAFGKKSGGGKRPAYKKRIQTVPNEVSWDTVDEAICQCYQADTSIESVALVNCTLQRVWPDVPWPHQPGDHRSVLRVWQAVGNRVATFMGLSEAQRAAACEDVPEPTEPTEPTDVDVDIPIGEWFGDAPGKLVRISQTHNYNPSKTVETVYGLSAGSANVARALMVMNRSGFNLLFYSRPRNNGAFGSASITTADGDPRNFDTEPAWFPWNMRVEQAALQGEKLKRWTNWSGSGPAAGGDRAFGSPFMPPVQYTGQGILIGTNADPWAPENNPPAEWLAKLGWSLDEMRTAWFAGNP